MAKPLKKLIGLFIFTVSCIGVSGQSVKRDSLLKLEAELKRELDSLNQLLNSCSDFKLQHKEKDEL